MGRCLLILNRTICKILFCHRFLCWLTIGKEPLQSRACAAGRELHPCKIVRQQITAVKHVEAASHDCLHAHTLYIQPMTLCRNSRGAAVRGCFQRLSAPEGTAVDGSLCSSFKTSLRGLPPASSDLHPPASSRALRAREALGVSLELQSLQTFSLDWLNGTSDSPAGLGRSRAASKQERRSLLRYQTAPLL